MLNLRSSTGRVYRNAVEKVFYETGLGLAEITAQSVRRHSHLVDVDPDVAERAAQEAEQAGSVQLDLENCYTALEQSPFYAGAMRAIKNETIDTKVQKIAIAGFIVFLRLRHPTVLSLVRERTVAIGLDPWVTLLGHWESCQNPEYISREGLPFAKSKWILHRAATHTFPLSDYPAVENEGGSRLLVTLSPRLLLEICCNTPDTGPAITRDFDARRQKNLACMHRRLCIKHATREIIFHDPSLLEEWRESPEYRARVCELRG